ncbi:PREDICTED: neogenin-like isoform X2 [Acropora digitifera]|uniref:neogenin-like isoform X2 n=1 Tax=Acropora digitifera TaxID=70779 RepID=UPI00077A35CD|nr:PREDICTED: neogenin-like isoform X2 [Acropora digitifera]
MEKTIKKLSLMLAMFHLVRMADGMAIGSKAHSSKQPVITYFGLQEATDIAFIGTNINLSCTMENAEVASFLKSGNPVAESERVTYFFQGSGNKLYGNLEISEVKEDDSGVYTCVAYKAGIVVTREFVLKIAHSSKQPVITYFGLHEGTDIAFIGTNINLSCTMENAEVASFLKSGNPVAESERVTYFFQGSGNELYGYLKISEVKEDDSGVYTCVAYKAGIVVTREFVLKIVHNSKQPVITYFGLHNATGIAFIGNNINLTCIMENTDVATFLKSDDPVDQIKRVTYFFQGSGTKLYGNLEISDVNKDDSGVYTCVAYRAGIVVTSKFVLKAVHSSKQPVITYFGLHNATGIAFIGNNINLTCTMENAGVGTFLKSGNPVVESERVTYVFQGSGNKLYANLEISELKKNDSGVYTCVAYRAGIVVTSKFVLKAVPHPSDVSAQSNNTRSLE